MSERLDFSDIKLGFRPNQFLLCPAGLNEDEAHQTAPEYLVSGPELKSALIRVLETVPRLDRIIWDEDKGYFDLIQRSALFRFPDRITIQVVSSPKNRSSLAIYSRSTYGYSDLGVNKARIEAWLSALDGELS